MRCLFPTPLDEVSYDDLVDLYDFPAPTRDGGWHVRANFVSSVDGAAQGTNLRAGTLSSEWDRRVFALLRSLSDVVLVGASTTRIERYRPVRPDEVHQALRSRLGLAPVPAIAVVSRSLQLDPELVAGGQGRTFVLTTHSAPPAAVAEVSAAAEVVTTGEEDVDLPAALDALASFGYRRVLCEGGPALLAAALAAGCVDDLCLTVSPQLAAGLRRRITAGPDLEPPQQLRLAHLLVDGSELYLRYVVDGG